MTTAHPMKAIDIFPWNDHFNTLVSGDTKLCTG